MEAAQIGSGSKGAMFTTSEREELEQIAARFERLMMGSYEDWARLRNLMQPLTEDRGVMKSIIKKGESAAGLPPAGSTITFHYFINVQDKEEAIDNSVERGSPSRCALGQGELLPGLDILLASMYPGQIAAGLIGYKYAFGEMGDPPRVGPKSDVLVFAELLSVQASSKAEILLALEPEERAKRPFEEIYAAALVETERGNALVKSGEPELRAGESAYRRAIALLLPCIPNTQEFVVQRKELLVRLYLNTAHCALQLAKPARAATACTQALELDPGNAKGFYRLGKAKRLEGADLAAKDWFLKALAVRPSDKDIAKELRSLEEELETEKRQQQLLYTNMLKDCQAKKPVASEKDGSTLPFYHQLKKFKDDPSLDSFCIPGGFFAKELKDFKQAAEILGLKVRVDNNISGERNIYIRK